MMPKPFASYVAQVWKNNSDKITEIDGLSYDAAREVAFSLPPGPYTGRIMDLKNDYVEVLDHKRGFRKGTFSETTLVIVQEEER